jgi:hypothetical protein
VASQYAKFHRFPDMKFWATVSNQFVENETSGLANSFPVAFPEVTGRIIGISAHSRREWVTGFIQDIGVASFVPFPNQHAAKIDKPVPPTAQQVSTGAVARLIHKSLMVWRVPRLRGK